MIASQREALPHTDITQLLILGKSGDATDERDMVYAFYGLTYLTSSVTYSRTPEWLFVEICHMYITALRYVASYDSVHGLTEQQKSFQLMSILYSAGTLHQHRLLPSWVPDWYAHAHSCEAHKPNALADLCHSNLRTFTWHLAPIFSKSLPNFLPPAGKDEWTLGVRSEHRAGGHNIHTFEILEGSRGQLRITAVIFDTILLVDEATPASTPGGIQENSRPTSTGLSLADTPEIRYGRHFFTTVDGLTGLATPGIVAGDMCAIFLSGDVPVILRPSPAPARKSRIFQLLCECYIQAPAVMSGELLHNKQASAEDIVLI